VHNLLPVELGALLWAIDFGGEKGTNHVLGMAKSLGYGGVRLTVENPKLGRVADSAESVDLAALAGAFGAWMEAQLQRRGHPGGWAKSRELFELLELAKPPSPEAEKDLRHMRLDHPAFGNEFSAAKADGLVLPPRGGATKHGGWSGVEVDPDVAPSTPSGSLLREATRSDIDETVEVGTDAGSNGRSDAPPTEGASPAPPAAAPADPDERVDPDTVSVEAMVDRLRRLKKGGKHLDRLRHWLAQGGEVAERAKEAGRRAFAKDVEKWKDKGKHLDLVEALAAA